MGRRSPEPRREHDPHGKEREHPPGAREGDPKLQPAEERGERLDTGKAIARGGKEQGEVPGAEPSE